MYKKLMPLFIILMIASIPVFADANEEETATEQNCTLYSQEMNADSFTNLASKEGYDVQPAHQPPINANQYSNLEVVTSGDKKTVTCSIVGDINAVKTARQGYHFEPSENFISTSTGWFSEWFSSNEQKCQTSAGEPTKCKWLEKKDFRLIY